MPKTQYYVFVVELNRNAPRSPRLRALNPDAPAGADCAYVAISTNQKPAHRYPHGDFSGSKNKVLKKYGKTLLSSYQSDHTKKEGALSQREKRVATLRAEGWFVMNSAPPSSCHVYVIELHPEAKLKKKVLTKNPDADPKKPPVYVGQTSKAVEERLREHQEGIRSNLGPLAMRLRKDLTGHPGPMTELESLRAERQLAYRLRKQGYTVLGGH